MNKLTLKQLQYWNRLKGQPSKKRGSILPEYLKKQISETLKRKGIKPPSQQGSKNPAVSIANSKRIGEKHPMWSYGKSNLPYSLDWTNSLRISIRERDKYTCQLCGEKQGDISFSVHHIDYNKQNCNPNNLITLCRPCHTKTNFNRERWYKYFTQHV